VGWASVVVSFSIRLSGVTGRNATNNWSATGISGIAMRLESAYILTSHLRSVTVQGQAEQVWMKLCEKAIEELAEEIALLLNEVSECAPAGRHARTIQEAIPGSAADKRTYQ